MYSYFEIYIFKTVAQIKKYDPSKVGFLRSNKVLGAQTKTQKIDFLKKPEICDLTEHWRWFPQ